MYKQLEGGFGSINPMLPMLGLGAKMEQKNKILKVTTLDLSRRASNFGVVERRLKMAELCPSKVWAKVASWPILGNNKKCHLGQNF